MLYFSGHPLIQKINRTLDFKFKPRSYFSLFLDEDPKEIIIISIIGCCIFKPMQLLT